MTDYGLIAYNRTEELAKEKIDNTFKLNTFVKRFKIPANTKFFVCNMSTAVNELIEFKLYTAQNCVLQIFVNDELNHSESFLNNIEFSLFVTGKSKIELKLLAFNQVDIKFNLAITGRCNVAVNSENIMFSGDDDYTFISSYNNRTKIINTDNVLNIVSDYNECAGTELNGEFVCGNYLISTFYYIETINNVSKLCTMEQSFTLDKKISGCSVMKIVSGENKPIKIINLNNGTLKLIEMTLTGTLITEKEIKLNNNFCISKIYGINSSAHVKPNNNYIIIKDTLNNFHLLLCNYAKMASLNQTFSCIALSKNGESASGYCLKNNEIIMIIRSQTGVSQIKFSNEISDLIPKKLEEKFYMNFNDKLFYGINYSVIELKGQLISYD